ncbi:hypothetical protein ACH5AR_12405 [Kitasatospora sp. NPDC018619]
MTDQQNSAPAVWDPTARGGAGGWVRGPQRPADAQSAPESPAAPAPAAPGPSTPEPSASGPATPGQSTARPGPMAPPPAPGAVGDQGPPLGARPYLAASPGYDPPTARLHPLAPPPPAVPPAAAPFPSPAGARPPQRTPGHDYLLQPPTAPPPPYGTGPDHPTAPGDEEERPTNRKAPLLIGFALLLVLALGGGLLFAVQGEDGNDRAAPAPASAPATGAENPPPAPAPTGADAPSAAASASGPPSGTPAPAPTTAGPAAQAQAQALDGLLSEGENAKAPIGSAVAKVTSCPAKADIESAAQTFDSGASQRAALLAKLAQLSVTDVPGGADAVNSLKSAWQLSADIDKAYASWARAVAAQGCTGRAPTTADKKHADELNPQATQAKTDFMNKWNPIAKNYGLTTRTQDRI